MKQAYLILTHGSFSVLERQLRFLDSPNADFYIHVDAKVQDFDFGYYAAIPHCSAVHFVPRYSISWGDYSMIEAEIALFEAATAGGYDYYHLLSGVDVPIKTREYIENFFAEHEGTNFITFQRGEISRANLRRVKYYYPFQKKNIRRRALRLLLQYGSVALQCPFVDRTKSCPPGFTFQKGSQWCSITHALAQYAVAQKEWARKTFERSFCSDEMFIQTLVINSPYRNTLPPHAFEDDHAQSCRYIDWKRGKPYVFTESDFDELIHAPENCLFARKFDVKNHGEIIEKLYDYFS